MSSNSHMDPWWTLIKTVWSYQDKIDWPSKVSRHARKGNTTRVLLLQRHDAMRRPLKIIINKARVYENAFFHRLLTLYVIESVIGYKYKNSNDSSSLFWNKLFQLLPFSKEFKLFTLSAFNGFPWNGFTRGLQNHKNNTRSHSFSNFDCCKRKYKHIVYKDFFFFLDCQNREFNPNSQGHKNEFPHKNLYIQTNPKAQRERFQFSTLLLATATSTGPSPTSLDCQPWKQTHTVSSIWESYGRNRLAYPDRRA